MPFLQDFSGPVTHFDCVSWALKEAGGPALGSPSLGEGAMGVGCEDTLKMTIHFLK